MLGGRVALLPIWLLAGLLAAGAAVGGLVLAADGAYWVAAGAGAVVAWGGVYAARRLLARRGHRSFDELPSADWEGGWRGGNPAATVAMLVWAAAGGAVYWALDALGLVGGEYVAFLVTFPAYWETDARMGVRARRRRHGEATEMRAAAKRQRARAAEHDDPGDTIGLRRGRAVLVAFSTAVAAPGMLALGMLGDDMSIFVRVIVLVCAPILAFVAFRWAAMARAPYFLRADARGADLVGSGPVPWEAIWLVEVNAIYGARWLELSLEDGARAEPWWTRAHGRIWQGGGLRAPIGFAAAEPEVVLALIARHHDDIEIDLGEEDAEGETAEEARV